MEKDKSPRLEYFMPFANDFFRIVIYLSPNLLPPTYAYPPVFPANAYPPVILGGIKAGDMVHCAVIDCS